MSNELTTYLIGLVPSITLIISMIPVGIKIYKWIKKIVSRDKELAEQVKEQNEIINKILADNSSLRKENLIQKRENRRLLSKITNVYIPEDKGE